MCSTFSTRLQAPWKQGPQHIWIIFILKDVEKTVKATKWRNESYWRK